MPDWHGYLPPFGRSALPPPPSFTPRNVLRTIGPGVIGLGVAIGSGEWLLGPSVIVQYGAALLWITTVSVGLQVLLNLEMARYTLYTGEPIMVGYMRTWPGPGFWGWTYATLSVLQYGWPGWALASATATAALVLGRMPTDADAGTVVALGYVTFGACYLIVLLGSKIERTIELAIGVMVTTVLAYLLILDVATVPLSVWGRTLQGFVRVGSVPPGADWALLGAFAAYSGLGGVGNAFVTNWMRDKGYGMAATVGYIPTAFGARTPLSAHGHTFEVDDRSLGDWRAWWRFVNVDQWLVFGFGSILGMALTSALTLHYVPPDAQVGSWAVANLQASGIALVHGPVFWYLTLICGLWILFSTQLGIVDGLPRSVTDILWSGSATVRRWRGGDARAVYYAALLLFAAWGCVAINLAQPLTLLIIGANIAGFNLLLEGCHTLIVNRRVLPPPLRPPRWREACLIACSVFYGGFFLGALLSLGR